MDKIGQTLQWEMNEWYQRYRKPVLITEYGAEALAGLHKVIHILKLTSSHTTQTLLYSWQKYLMGHLNKKTSLLGLDAIVFSYVHCSS